MRTALPVSILLVLAALPAYGTSPGEPSLSPSTQSPMWTPVQHFVHVPITPDATAFFFRLLTLHTTCIEVKFEYLLDPSEGVPLPALREASASGVVTRLPGMPPRDSPEGWGGFATYSFYEGASYQMVNVSVGNTTFYTSYKEWGQEPQDEAFHIETGFSSCNPQAPTERWFYIMTHDHALNLTLTVDLYEIWNDTEYEHGNAQGVVTYLAESNRTFFKQLRDFHGTAAYNGDVLPGGYGPKAAALNVETRLHAERGLIGGFADWEFAPTVLSYVNPQGDVGTGASAGIGKDLGYLSGSRGDWTFRAHAYASTTYSRLFLWGADLDTGVSTDPDLLEPALP